MCYALPFAAVLAIAAGLYAYDGAVWSRGEWGTYRRFDDSRIAMSDYGIPAYEEIPETYDARLSETAVEVLQSWNFYDPDLFNKETMDAITADRDVARARAEPWRVASASCSIPARCDFSSIRPCTCCSSCSRSGSPAGSMTWRGWFTFAFEIGIFCVFYLYLIRRGRYLVDRVGYGAFHGGHHRPDLDSEKGVLQ